MNSQTPLMISVAITGLMLSLAGPAQSTSPQLHLESDGQVTSIELKADAPVKIDPVTGDITLTPAEADSLLGASVTIDLFTLNKTNVPQGEKIVINWEALGGRGCRGLGLPGSDWNTASFSRKPWGLFSASTGQVTPGIYDIGIVCANEAVLSPVVTRSLTIEEPDSDECIADGRLPPLGMSREPRPKFPGFFQSRVAADTWVDMYGLSFPRGSATQIGISPDHYLSLPFNTGTQGSKGKIAFADTQAVAAKTAPAVATISHCPGDFGPQENATCHKRNVGTEVGSFWWTRDTANPGFDCPVEPNEDMYLNVVYADPDTVLDSSGQPDPDPTWLCGGERVVCGHNTDPTFIK